MDYILGIDHGNKNMKTSHHVFTSGVTASKNKPAIDSADTLQLNGLYYTLTSDPVPFMLDKTQNDNFFILTLFGIAKELIHRGMPNGEYNIKLGAGLPPKHLAYMSQKFSSYLADGHTGLNIVYCNHKYTVNIMECQVFPQAYAAAMTLSDRSILEDYEVVLLIDIGGFTVDLIELRKGIPLPDKCYTLEMGLLTLYDAITMEIMNEYSVSINTTIIDNVLSGKKTALTKEMIDTVNQSSKIWIDSVINKIREYGYDTRIIPTIWEGGGSITFKDKIDNNQMVGLHDYVPDIRANAQGYELFYKALCS